MPRFLDTQEGMLGCCFGFVSGHGFSRAVIGSVDEGFSP
jgi:hypothetical protein